jgi:hypothetical protein
MWGSAMRCRAPAPVGEFSAADRLRGPPVQALRIGSAEPDLASSGKAPAGGARRVGNRRSCVKHRHCPGFDVAGLVAATRVSLPLTNTFMEFSDSPDSSVYS